VKNLSMAMKMGILVVLLLATALTIAAVSVRELSHLTTQFGVAVNTTGRQMLLAEECRVALLAAVRAEKNAVLVSDKAQAAEFAKLARENLQKANTLRDEMASVAGTDQDKDLVELGRSLDEFAKNQKEVLRLAVIKSNLDATGILHKELHARVHDFEEFNASLAESDGAPVDAPATGRVAAKVAAGQQVISRFYDLMYHLSLHIDSDSEQEMIRMDQEIRPRVLAFQESLRKFSVLLSDTERARGSGVLATLEAVKSQTTKIQDLSHVNSDLYAQRLTVTSTLELGNVSDAILANIIKKLSERRTEQQVNVSDAAAQSRNIVIGVAVIGGILSLILGFLITRSIVRPVELGVRVFERIAAGDLTQRMGLDQRDEMGRLAAASDQMVGRLHEVVTRARALADRLGDSAAELSGVSHDLLSQSQEMSTQAETVAAATEQMSANITGMASAAEQMSSNVSSISSASEEVSVNVASVSASAAQTSRNVGVVAESIGQITHSLKGVAQEAKEGSQLTQQARDLSVTANQAMQQLGQAASEINKVTEVIKSIALQTNLLALNATIEATSAGEAGKGFAVVAGEVKELASQSGQSAEEIARKIEGVQASTREAIKVIENVTQFMERINVSSARIHDAVDVQTQAANQISVEVASARKGVEEIARSIAEVAKGATDVSGNTAEVSKAATDVSRNAAEAAGAVQSISPNIHGVSEATRQNSAAAVKVNEAALRCKDISADLQKAVAHFNLGRPSGGEASPAHG
jgi:methyl-accepting chemotaxis protein